VTHAGNPENVTRRKCTRCAERKPTKGGRFDSFVRVRHASANKHQHPFKQFICADCVAKETTRAQVR
jgi:hypothetical protein